MSHNNEEEDIQILDEQTGSKTPIETISIQHFQLPELTDEEILDIINYAKRLSR